VNQPTSAVVETTIPGARLFRRGKVRDVYEVGADQLIIVASDRLSAFDVVLPTPIPDRGRILTQLSNFWFAQTTHIVPNHVIETDPARFPAPFAARAELAGRAVLVKRCERVDIECVARGYLSGSAWAEYQQDGTVAQERLVPGLVEAERLLEPIFTPATKALTGHDENISRAQLAALVGRDLAKRLEEVTLALYRYAHAYALGKGLILADTKFEFGFDAGTLRLIDEALTPDSSRYWEAASWRPGSAPPSYDKQFVRDFLARGVWNKEPPGPALPAEVVEGTRARYLEAYRRLTGQPTL
jgi:phosphoribosylaminoimidazole-succinocarboxamide synthase